ncbi:MAG: efflux RND transporter periplasmic adaptor subunit [Endomicrobia bacterium]|nr:efflux RND transporter periplasmic adaptor subunit [Endomicrobiia bacterium]
MKKPVIILILAVIVVAAAYFFLTRKGEFLYNGTVEAVEVDLSSRVSGVIKKHYVEEGSSVKAGDLLVEIDSKDALLAFELAKRDFDRARELIKSNTITQERYDAVRYKYEDAQERLSWTKIVSPLDAAVIYKFHENGEFVTPGTKLLTLSDMREVDVNIYVPHDILANLRVGTEVKGFLPELGDKEFTGTIAFINDKAEFTPRNVLTRSERSRLVFRVKIRFPNPDGILKSAMTLEVRLPTAE